MHLINRKIPQKVEIVPPVVRITQFSVLPTGDNVLTEYRPAPFTARVSDFTVTNLQNSGIPLEDLRAPYIHSSLGDGADNLSAAAAALDSSVQPENTPE